MVYGRKTTCARKTITVCNWFPVIVITLIIGWSYYAFVYSLCIVMIPWMGLKIVLLVVYHILLLLFLWSYVKVILEVSPEIPPEFTFPPEEWESLNSGRNSEADNQELIKRFITERNLPVCMLSNKDGINWCHVCGQVKPDRCHHCSVCNRCILKMDHHCPWTNNCVGFHSHKFFILFLAYGSIYCLFILAASSYYFGQFWSQINGITVDQFMILFLFVVSLMFAICQLALCGYHIHLISRNMTTLESTYTPKFRSGISDKRAFDMGRVKNFRQTFGSNCLLALLPVRTTVGDGIIWEYRVPTMEYGMECGVSAADPLAAAEKQ